MAAGRKRTTTVKRAAAFLVRRQNADGGFPLVPGGASNAQSTAWAVQGLLAAGRDPAKVRRSRDPLAYLRSLTSPSGEVRYSRTSRQTPVWVTAQAVMALARKPLPLKPVARAKRAQAAPAGAGAHRDAERKKGARRRPLRAKPRRGDRGGRADARRKKGRRRHRRRARRGGARGSNGAYRAGFLAGLAAYAVL